MIVHPLHSDIAKPERFTYPFCYEPHPLCQLAAKEVQAEAEGEGNDDADRQGKSEKKAKKNKKKK